MTVITVENLTKKYGTKTAIQDISFSVQKGRITGLLGPNGAGKTTTMRVMTGFLEPSRGTIHFDGMSLVENPSEIKSRLGYLPENAPLYQDMLVFEYLQFISKARGIEPSISKAAIDRAIHLCELESHLYYPIHQLSKGYRQRVALAGTLIHDPDYIILDEPSSGLDPNQIFQIRSLIRNLGKEKNLILSTHILQEVVEVCDQVLILSNGKTVLNNSVDGIRNNHLIYFATTASQEKLLPLLISQGMTELKKLETLEDGFSGYTIDSKGKGGAGVFQALVELNYPVSEIRPFQKSLESIFGELTRGKL